MKNRLVSHYEYVILDVPEMTQEIIDEHYPEDWQPLCKFKEDKKQSENKEGVSMVERGCQSLTGGAQSLTGGVSMADTEKDKDNNTNNKELKEEQEEGGQENLDEQLWVTIGQLYKKVFDKKISDFQIEALESYLEDNPDLEPEVIPLALKEAGLNNANTFQYVITTLDDWLERELVTADKVLAMKEKRAKRKQGSKKSSHNKGQSKGKVRGSNTYQPLSKEERNSDIPIDKIKQNLKKHGLIKPDKDATCN